MAMRRKVIAGAAAALAVGGAGAGVAATKLTTNSPSEESKAIVNDAAKSLGVEPSKLSAALKKAFEDRIDAAVADGRLTKAQGDELKQRIESGELPALRGRPASGTAPAARTRSLPRARRRCDLPRPDRGPAAQPARERQDAGRDRQGAGQVRRRPEGRAGQGREGEARRRRQGRPALLGRGAARPRRPAAARRRPRQRQAARSPRRPARLRLPRPAGPPAVRGHGRLGTSAHVPGTLGACASSLRRSRPGGREATASRSRPSWPRGARHRGPSARSWRSQSAATSMAPSPAGASRATWPSPRPRCWPTAGPGS